MKVRAARAVVFALAAVLASCAGAGNKRHEAQDPAEPPPSLLARSVPDGTAKLQFPPAAEGRRPRRSLAAELHGASEHLELRQPSLAPGRTFVVHGKELVFRFNKRMRGAAPGAPAAGIIALEPPVPGLAAWRDEHTLEFRAARFFDPAEDYEVVLRDVASLSGERIDEWKASFESSVGAVIAGKNVGHVPVLGQARVVAVLPGGGASISPRPRLRVLYDQPVHLAVARKLVRLKNGDGNEVPLSIAHAPVDAFEGARVDRRFVVIASPRRPLEAKARYVFSADDGAEVPSRRTHPVELEVAAPLTFVEASCGWWVSKEQVCEQKDGRLRTDRREIHLSFNNDLRAVRSFKAHVRVSPPVANLSVSEIGWDEGRLAVRGDFRASTRYRVTVAGLRDVFDQPLRQSVALDVEVMPLGASVSMPEGLVMLDERNTRAFSITSRNVAEAEISVWKIADGDVEAFRKALARTAESAQGQVGEGAADARLKVAIAAKKDELVTTLVDLRPALGGGASYLATIAPKRFAFGSAPAKLPEGSAAARPPVALLRPAHPKSLRVHAHSVPGHTVVQVARLASGEPVKGARVRLSSGGETVTTSAQGVALLPHDTSAPTEAFLSVQAPGDKLLLPLSRSHASAGALFPELASGAELSSERRAVIVTDRGIYRPGSAIEMKASVYQPERAALRPVRDASLKLRVLGPTGIELCARTLKTSDMGSVTSRCTLPAGGKLGLHRIQLEEPAGGPPLAVELVRVAAFEAPRFKVDVESSIDGGKLAGSVRAQYLFGAPMDGATVDWTLKREPAELPPGALSEAGLAFRPVESWWSEDEEQAEAWSRSGTALLDGKGEASLAQAIAVEGTGPQRFVLEADVTDSSYRHVAARTTAVAHPAPRYAGLRVGSGWVAVGKPVPVELGVVDREGRSVLGATAVARLMRVEWRHQRVRVAGGAVRSEWRRSETEVARCSVRTEERPVACKLPVARAGDYRVVAEVDGRAGGAGWFWAWSDGSDEPSRAPSRGSAIQVVADKASYAAGDKARLLARNPFPAAVAVLTIEQGGLISHREKRVEGGAALFEVPIEARHAPHVHATVTLLPVGASGEAAVAYRVGAARLAVKAADTRLRVTVESDEPSYRPGAEAEIRLQVHDGKKPEAHAEVALAVVDEGVLRLTGFRAIDPSAALRPKRALSFLVRDSHAALAELLERSHVAGDGGGDELGSLQDARRRFVETALWRPSVRTDAQGRATVRFRLPDNLTEFRMMAVAIDDEGKGGAAEQSFVVNKPLMLDPVLPRFAHAGDRFEAAALVHNQTDRPFDGTVRIGEQRIGVQIAPKSKHRVGMAMRMQKPGEHLMRFVLEDAKGKSVDAAERRLAVTLPGMETHPSIDGAFAGEQRVSLALPRDAIFEPGAELVIQAGQHLWPELGARLEYLLRYPYGCVEQTTSSTLPLIAAREILPSIGADRYGEAFFRERIEAGLKRLAKMKTAGGGLGYWPGDGEPNLYGTSYAIRAVWRAKQAGIEPPEGLLEGMKKYLREELVGGRGDRHLRATVAHSLAEMGELPASILDSLWSERGELDLFGKASLAMALGSLPAQADRTKILLDEIEAAFGEGGAFEEPQANDRHWYYGSDERTRAQVAMALTRHRRSSKLLVALVRRLAEEDVGYTTQGTAFSLMALSDHLTAAPVEGAQLAVLLDGKPLEPSRKLGAGSVEMRVPLAELTGKKRTLTLRGPRAVALGFRLHAGYRLPLPEQSEGGGVVDESLRSAADGPDVYRMFTTAEGAPLDLGKVKAGELVRVAILVRLPESAVRRGYLAISDRIAAGFEPVDPDLSSVASAPSIDDQHPLAELLRYQSEQASHLELRDDRVHIHFDRLHGDTAVASYLLRATTPGTFVLPPATAELMYVPDSMSYTEGGRVTIL